MDLSTLTRDEVKIVEDDLAQVLAQTIADYEARSGKVLQPAHIERLIINTYAYRETLLRQQINEAYRQQHPRFATGLMLDLCGDDVNTPRLEAQAAMTTLRFSAPSLSDGQTVAIPQGTRVGAGEVVFATRDAALLTAQDKTAEVLAVCAETGTRGNGWSTGQVNQLLDNLNTAVEVKVANISVSTGGVDIESDDAYRERVLLAPESFSVAGSVGAYQYWARQVSPSIVDVHVANDLDRQSQPIGGTVAITILTQTGVPQTELINAVQVALSNERKRPLCDTVIVRAPQVVDYSATATLTLLEGVNEAEVLAAAQAAWQAYEQSRRFKLGLDIVPLDIQTALKVAGVYNVVLSGVNLTAIAPNQWARCTRMTIQAARSRADG